MGMLPFIAVMHNPSMTLAFVFLSCDIGTGSAVMGEMRGIPGVSDATGVSGVYDIVARMHSDSNKGITSIVRRFHTIAHVRSCSTVIVASEHDAWQQN
jgi:hypothetical protein